MRNLLKFKVLPAAHHYAKAFCVLNIRKGLTILCCFALYVTTAHASDGGFKAQQSIAEQNQDLNGAIYSIMRWYEDVLKHRASKRYYPENIQNIQILEAKLLTTPRDNIALKVWMGYLKNGETKIQQVKENFVFDFNRGHRFVGLNKLSSKAIYSDASLGEYDVNYYQQRRFVYAWLAFMDDNANPKLLKKAIEDAHYQWEIGTQKFSGLLLQALNRRNTLMGKGRHFLRSIDSEKVDGKLQLTLLSSWRGVSPKNKPSIAKIEQIIELKETANGYKILRIKEQHLLPDIAPWEKLLC